MGTFAGRTRLCFLYLCGGFSKDLLSDTAIIVHDCVIIFIFLRRYRIMRHKRTSTSIFIFGEACFFKAYRSGFLFISRGLESVSIDLWSPRAGS